MYMQKKHIIGVIGGMGPQASAEFYRLLVEGAKLGYGARNNDEFPEILLDSVPVPDFLADTRKMEEAALLLEDRTRRLTAFGASVLTMACNTACILSDRLEQATDKPFIFVVDEVVRRVAEEGKRALLLASPTSLRLGLYQVQLAHYGVPHVVPHKREYRELEHIIRATLAGEDRTFLTKKLTKIAERYVQAHNVDGIILGCTELPLVFPSSYRLPVYNSLSILAESVLKRYYKEVI